MKVNEREYEKYQQILKNAMTTCKTTQDEVRYLREKCYDAVAKLYWMSVKMSNHRQIFSEEQLEEADYLYSEFSQLTDMCDDITEQMTEIGGFVHNLTELFSGEGICECSEEDMLNFMQKYKNM